MKRSGDVNEAIRWCRGETRLGTVRLAARGEAIVGLWFEGQKHDVLPDETWRETPGDPLLREAFRQLRDYLAGKRDGFDFAIAPEGTPFQRSVWREIARVPAGRTASYGDLARRLRRPSSVRAVGAAVGRNPLSVVVPCHRIVGSDGSLTGYAGGLDRKRALLALERVELDASREGIAGKAGSRP